MQDNVARKAAETNNTQTKNGFNIFKRSGYTSLRADPDVCDDDVNKARRAKYKSDCYYIDDVANQTKLDK